MFHQDLTENDLKEVRNLLSRHFAQKARVEAQKYVLENNISQKELKQTTDLINDNRTEYLRKIPVPVAVSTDQPQYGENTSI